MIGTLSPTTPRGLTIMGLVAGAIGIAMLWASGVEFPVYPPPGILILGAGAVFVAMAKWPWAPGVGAFLGLFVIAGFVMSSVVSGTGTGILAGSAGVGGVLGSVIQLIGVVTALVAGVLATSQEYRTRRRAHGAVARRN
jgi:hypothetical protein